MYASYFGLKREPFSIAPDPHYLFMSERHREALAHLLYGLGGGGGFVLLTGEIGTGKTTLCRLFLEQIPKDCNVAYIFNPKLTVIELLQSVCEEFHVDVPRPEHVPTVKDYLDPLNDFLLREHAAGRNNVLIIDEAQNLAMEVLEQLRLLTNLETNERKLLQIILIGQPELRQMLARPELEQLAQRVVARYHLDALTPAETDQYVRHRLDVAGLERPFPFEAKAMKRVHQLSRGVPRRINLLCDRAMLGAFANSRATVDASTVDKAAAEVFSTEPAQNRTARPAIAAAFLVLLAGAGLVAANRLRLFESSPTVPAVASAAKPAASAPTADAAQPAASAASAPVVAASAGASAAVAAAKPPQLLRDMNQAWRELAQGWGAELDDAEREPCAALARQQLQCFSRTMTLALIRELGRPGIVTLDADTPAPSYAILRALTRDTATLRAAGTEQTVTLAALAERWKGDFATLWRVPPGYPQRNQPRGEFVDWVAAQLAEARKQPAPTQAATMNAELIEQVRAFQLARGLTPDGQLGPMTYMQLNRVGGADEPRLRTSP